MGVVVNLLREDEGTREHPKHVTDEFSSHRRKKHDNRAAVGSFPIRGHVTVQHKLPFGHFLVNIMGCTHVRIGEPGPLGPLLGEKGRMA
jgi:hypothetical protein